MNEDDSDIDGFQVLYDDLQKKFEEFKNEVEMERALNNALKEKLETDNEKLRGEIADLHTFVKKQAAKSRCNCFNWFKKAKVAGMSVL